MHAQVTKASQYDTRKSKQKKLWKVKIGVSGSHLGEESREDEREHYKAGQLAQSSPTP